MLIKGAPVIAYRWLTNFIVCHKYCCYLTRIWLTNSSVWQKYTVAISCEWLTNSSIWYNNNSLCHTDELACSPIIVLAAGLLLHRGVNDSSVPYNFEFVRTRYKIIRMREKYRTPPPTPPPIPHPIPAHPHPSPNFNGKTHKTQNSPLTFLTSTKNCFSFSIGLLVRSDISKSLKLFKCRLY